jgi:hypothetical protein
VPDDEPLDLDLLSSSLQADAGDVRLLLRVLVERLSGALGSRLRVQRSGGRLFGRSGEIEAVTINLGEDQLEANMADGQLQCLVSRRSGGIRIRSARVSMDEWLRRLLEALNAEASTSEKTRSALEAILIPGNP